MDVFSSITNWKFFYIIIAALLILSAVIFGVFGQGTPASWAERSWDLQATHKMLDRVELVGRGAECGIMEMRTIDEYLSDSKDQAMSFA